MIKLLAFARIGVIFTILAAGAAAVAADETYEVPDLHDVVLAKVWGNVCPGVVTAAELSEIQAFIVRLVSTVDEGYVYGIHKYFSARKAVKEVERHYTDAYRDQGRCLGIEAGTVEAILESIRKASADPAFWTGIHDAVTRGYCAP